MTPYPHLRYGYIKGDGSNELVLFLANDIVIFSPEKQKIVFSEEMSMLDWYSKEDSKSQIESAPQLKIGDTDPQYISITLAD